jgi:hypothetical protein
MGVIYQSQTGFPADDPEGCPLIGWHNLVTASNVTSTTADTDYPISNVANPATHLKWVGTYNTGDEYITISGLGGEVISYIGVARHNWGTLGIPVSVEVQNDSPAVFTEIVTAQTLSDDAPIIFRIVPQSVQNIRIKLAVTDTSALPEAAVIYAGELLVLERSINLNKHVPITYGRRTNIVNGMSESGNFLGRIVTGEWRNSKAEFEWFTPEFYRSDIDDFLASAQDAPFFWAWSPDEYPAETGYCWLTNDAEPEVDPATRRVALTLEMRGVA